MKIYSQNINLSSQATQNINFHATDSIKLKTLESDSLELSSKEKKNELSTASKIAIGIGSTAAIIFGLKVGLRERIKYLYNKKFVISNLPEKIEFKKASNLDEAIKYTQEILGIKNLKGFDKENGLEALNVINKGLTDVANAHKGKCFLPTSLHFKDLNKKENTIAFVQRGIGSKNFGSLTLNKKFFDDKFIKERIEKYLYLSDNTPYYKFNNDKLSCPFANGFLPVPKQELLEMIKKYYDAPDKLSIEEKRNLFHSLIKGFDNINGKMRNPIKTLEKLLENDCIKTYLTNNNKTINLEKIKQMKLVEQQEYLKNLLNEFNQNNVQIISKIPKISSEKTIYHEMGHLQDYHCNLKELHLKGSKIFNFNINALKEIDSRWGRLGQNYFDELLRNNPEKMKKDYPEMYEFLTNEEIQRSVGTVSKYAQSGIGEFVAETYEKMISGVPLDSKVIDLYKKYNGPRI